MLYILEEMAVGRCVDRFVRSWRILEPGTQAANVEGSASIRRGEQKAQK